MIVHSGKLLMKRRKAALEQEARQVDAHDGWTARLPKDAIKEWEMTVLAWERASHPKKEVKGLVNPYAIRNECKCNA